MVSKKLVRYIAGSVTHDPTITAEQFADIQNSLNEFVYRAKAAIANQDFQAMKSAMAIFIEAQDGVGSNEDNGGTGLLGDTDLLDIGVRSVLRRGKSDATVHLLVDSLLGDYPYPDTDEETPKTHECQFPDGADGVGGINQEAKCPACGKSLGDYIKEGFQIQTPKTAGA